MNGRPLGEIGAAARTLGISRRRLLRYGGMRMMKLDDDARNCIMDPRGGDPGLISDYRGHLDHRYSRKGIKIPRVALAYAMRAIAERMTGEECRVVGTLHAGTVQRRVTGGEWVRV